MDVDIMEKLHEFILEEQFSTVLIRLLDLDTNRRDIGTSINRLEFNELVITCESINESHKKK